jgi:hypothetical protein
MLWLRWRLTRNQWMRGGTVHAVIAMLFLAAAAVLAVGGSIGGLAGGFWGLSPASPEAMLWTWDALVATFLFWWTTGLITELQRSEMLDLSRFLHLPLSLGGVFLLNYLASHLSLSLALMLPAMLGLAVGLVLGSGPAMALLVPLVLAFVLMITAWTYCLRGWLAALMVNKRRRRAVIVGVTMVFLVCSQLPNLLTNLWLRGEMPSAHATAKDIDAWAARRAAQRRRTAAVFDAAHCYVPLLWLPQGAKALAEHRPWPAALGALGMAAIGALGLARAYRGTLRFYRGAETKKPLRATSPARTRVAGRRILVERALPLVPEEAAAVGLAGLRSMSRAPEVKMALAANVFIFGALGATAMLPRGGNLPDSARPFIASTAVVVTFFGLAQLMFNHFGFDRGGFQALVLLPASRRRVLLGKNLALLPVALAIFPLYLGLAIALAHLGAWDVLAAGFEFLGAFATLSVLGNVASILVPYRIAAGSLRPTKVNGLTQLLIFLTHLLFPLAAAPVYLPPALGLLLDQTLGPPAGAVATPACAAVFALLSALLYWRTSGPLGDLLQRRERAILPVVTQEVE